jgi:hypothetical protein
MHRPSGQARASKKSREPTQRGSSSQDGVQVRGAMKTKDTLRKWMWLILGVGAALQLYFVRELLAAFAIFVLGFAVIAVVIASFYMLQKAWESGLGQLLSSKNSWVLAVRHGVATAEDWGRRPIRRPDSELPTNV